MSFECVTFDFERSTYKPSTTKIELTSTIPPPVYNQGLCPATHVYTPLHSLQSYGVQCKYRAFHTGLHCGYVGITGVADIFWDD